MPDPTTTPDVLRMLQDIDRRLRALEAAPQLQRASLTGGTITALNDDDVRVAEFGRLVDGKYGIAVNEADAKRSLLYVNDEDGYWLPVLEHGFSAAGVGVNITSGSFAIAHTALVPVPLGRILVVVVDCVTDAGTTGELRLRLSTGETSDVKTLPAGATTGTSFRWDYGGDIGLGIDGFFVYVEARRTGGAGNVNVRNPRPLREASSYAGTPGGL